VQEIEGKGHKSMPRFTGEFCRARMHRSIAETTMGWVIE
jgi:hypothetical protein